MTGRWSSGSARQAAYQSSSSGSSEKPMPGRGSTILIRWSRPTEEKSASASPVSVTRTKFGVSDVTAAALAPPQEG